MPGSASPALAQRRFGPILDLIAFICVFGLVFSAASVVRESMTPLAAADAIKIHLEPRYLPDYAMRTTFRMFVALLFSLLFTFTYATWAAKSRRAATVLIPILDVLQSVPILGFLSFTVLFFLNLFPGRVLGADCAAIFAIFTSQAWNMAFSFYQSLTTVPADLDEAAVAFRLSPWQRFWRLETPFAMPGLIWNTMMSMSGGWFFVVASEAISVGDTNIKLPGIGSYLAMALDQRDAMAVGWAILAMGVVILLYDQLLFRPLVAWSDKFRFETTAVAAEKDPWMLRMLRQTWLLREIVQVLSSGSRWVSGRQLRMMRTKPRFLQTAPARWKDGAFYVLIAVAVIGAVGRIGYYISSNLHFSEILEVLRLGCYTMIRVAVLMALASLIWVPVGVWLGLRPRWARRAQPVAQFMAAFPANLFFPIFVVAILRFHLNSDIWLTPLMILGTQWYILFNVIAGAMAFPGDLREAASHFRIRGWLWWRRVILPGIMPYYITGAITASGGCWNAAIVSEVASWGKDKIYAHGLGAYIAQATDDGNTARIIMGVAVMSGFVLLVNRLLWRPLYHHASRRLAL